MNEISRLSDRTNSQGENSENRSRQNSDGFHRRLAGLDGVGRMDPGASTSGSKNDVGRSGDELEGVRRKSDEERKLDRKFNNYIQEIARNSNIAIINERSEYYKFKEGLFNDQKRSDEKRLELIEQYVKEKIEQPIKEPKQKSYMQQLLKRLVKHAWNYFPDQESSTLQRTAVEAQSEQDKQKQEELDTHLNKLLENNECIRLKILKLLKNKIDKVSDSDEKMGVFHNWATEIDEYLRLRAKVSILQDVMNDIQYCYTVGKSTESHIESLSKQEKIRDAANEIKEIFHGGKRMEEMEEMEIREIMEEMERMERMEIMEGMERMGRTGRMGRWE